MNIFLFLFSIFLKIKIENTQHVRHLNFHSLIYYNTIFVVSCYIESGVAVSQLMLVG